MKNDFHVFPVGHGRQMNGPINSTTTENRDELLRANRALKASEERFRALVETTSDFLWEVDAGGVYTYVSPKVIDLLGYGPAEVVGRTPFDFMPPDEAARVGELFAEEVRFRRSFRALENVNIRKDGTHVVIETSGVPILDDEGRLLSYRGIDRDISERKRMEEALRKSEAMYSMITQNMSDTLWLMDMNLKPIWISPSVERKRGYVLDQIQTMPLEKQLTPPSLRTVLEAVAVELAPERLGQKDLEISLSMELEFCRKDGSTYWSDVKFSVIRDRQGCPIGVLGVGRDIDERKRAEEALRQSEERFSKAFHISPAPTLINAFDDGRCVDVNDSFLRLLGYTREEMIGRTEAELRVWETRDDYNRAVRKLAGQGFILGAPLHLRTKDGKIRDVLVSAELITLNDRRFALSICYDVTEQRRLESQLRRSQKMEAVGTLSGGIAHDFNNILGAVMGYTEIALMEPETPPRLKRYLEQIHKAGERATYLVQQILTFSRQGEEKPQPMRVSPIIKEVLQLLRASFPSTIRIRQEIQAEHDTVLADPTQIHQIMMNLCTNAAHAMRESKGELTIRLASVDIRARDPLLIHHALAAGRYLNLTVGDTGVGIEPAIMERIFDPFFTTKEPGEGTGMGLAVVHGIVKSCCGAVTVKSDVGQGAEFNVYFPLLPEEPEGRLGAGVAEPVAGGKERLLFVDDEDVLVQVGREMLRGLGYEVVGCTGSLEALELFRSQPERFDLVITDMTMPNMTGVELFREIRKIRPSTPVILCSGFSEAMTREKAQALGVSEFIQKPIVYQQIAPAIRRVLDREG
jgi:PAS domain S-box-containing protein